MNLIPMTELYYMTCEKAQDIMPGSFPLSWKNWMLESLYFQTLCELLFLFFGEREITSFIYNVYVHHTL